MTAPFTGWGLARLLGRTSARGAADAAEANAASAPAPVPVAIRVPSDHATALRFSRHAEWRECISLHEACFAARWRIECDLSASHALSAGVHGYCRFCEQLTTFALPSQQRGEPANLREELLCGSCGLNARVRAGLALLDECIACFDRPRIYITEQASLAFARLSARHPGVIGTEFFQDDAARTRLEHYLAELIGTPTAPVFGDITDLPFADASLDAVVSFDVLEHVPAYRAALAEFARVLAPAGALVLTAPFLPGEDTTQTLARIKADGSIEHLRPPEYHGDPLSPEGVLCFHHFGWDLLAVARECGFSSAEFVLPWNVSTAEVGGCWTLVARR